MADPHKQLLRTGIVGDGSAPHRIINKGRQIGFSYFIGLESLLIAQLKPNTRQYYIATNEKQAKEWLEKVEDLAKCSKLWIDGSRFIDIDEKRSTILEKVIKHFPKEIKKKIAYSYIVGLAASPEGARGSTGIAVTLDEYDQMRKTKDLQQKLYNAVRYFISQGGQMTIQSTPLTKTDKFWDIYVNHKQYLMTAHYFPVIENWKEINLTQDLRHQDLKIPYSWVNVTELEKARRHDLDEFKQEVLGIPADVMIRFFEPELIEMCADSFPAYQNRDGQGMFKIAIDLAQKRDISAVTVGELIEDKIYERHVEETQLPYTQQVEHILRPLCQRYKPLEIIIDNTGVGIAIGDIIEDDPSFPPLRRVDFASYVVLGEKKVRMTHYLAEEFKRALIDGRYRMIRDETALDHCFHVEKVVTDSGQIRYTGKRGGNRDDHFWSKAMLNANLRFEDVNPVFGIYEPGRLDMKQGGIRSLRKMEVQENYLTFG